MTKDDVAQNLKSYFLGTIIGIQNEYEWQISKWKPYMKRFADAQTAARKRVEDVLSRVEADSKVAEEVVLGALLFVAGKTVEWLGSALKDRLASRYKDTFHDVFTREDGYFSWSVKAPGKVRAEFFGATIEPIGNLVVSQAIKKITPTEAKDNNLQFNSLRVLPYESFATAISSGIDEEIRTTKALLSKMHLNCNNDREFGYNLLNALPESKNPRMSLDQLERIGIDRIVEYVDTLRQKYAGEWWYFGNNPNMSRLLMLDDRMEVELWAMWVLDQNYKVTEIGALGKLVLGKDEIPLTHRIMSRLVNDLFQTALIDLEYHTQRVVGPILGKIHKETIELGDLPTLQNWAKRHPGAYAAGKLDHKPRQIGTIRDPSTIYQ